MYLDCHGWKLPTTTNTTAITTTKFVSGTDCRTFLSNGTLNFSNRYDIKETSQDSLNIKYLGNQTKIYNEFMKLNNDTVKLNKNNGHIVAIPIIGYHSIDNNNNNKSKDSTPTTLFEQEMKYLHDNNFKTITMNDLLYNSTSNTFYLRNSTE
jgi:CHASE2 domain-containing sensor protein